MEKTVLKVIFSTNEQEPSTTTLKTWDVCTESIETKNHETQKSKAHLVFARGKKYYENCKPVYDTNDKKVYSQSFESFNKLAKGDGCRIAFKNEIDKDVVISINTQLKRGKNRISYLWGNLFDCWSHRTQNWWTTWGKKVDRSMICEIWENNLGKCFRSLMVTYEAELITSTELVLDYFLS